MTFAKSVRISAASAVSTLEVVDRQTRKDLGKIAAFTHACYILATSPTALKAYRQTWKSVCQLCEIIWLILCLLFSLLEQWAEREVSRHLPVEVEEVEAITPTEPVEVAEPEPMPIEAIEVVEEVEAIATDSGTPDWAALDPFQLRKACQKAGIRWRNANGKNRHMSKPQMVEALGAIAVA